MPLIRHRRAPCGARLPGHLPRPKPCYFNPRAPCGARRTSILCSLWSSQFQSTRPLRGATGRRLIAGSVDCISIHAPLAGRDGLGTCSPGSISQFQSTRPLRGATSLRAASQLRSHISIHAPLAGRDAVPPVCTGPLGYFNPRAPCGARLAREVAGDRRADFNPRAPCGARLFPPLLPPVPSNFNPRAPCGARPPHGLIPSISIQISIHAPLAGRDERLTPLLQRLVDFNPRAPCGARQRQRQYREANREFQSTRPLRGATTSGCGHFVAS